MQEHHPRVSPTGIAYLGIRQRRREVRIGEVCSVGDKTFEVSAAPIGSA
jgi:hypothetical protein